MVTLLRSFASFWILLVTLGPVASSENDHTPELYRRGLEISRTNVVVCAEGSVEQRLDCLGREIDRLNRRLEDMGKPRVTPLGVLSVEEGDASEGVEKSDVRVSGRDRLHSQ
jgi:hypothetical protein